jgi:lysophospholipase L1-like esterase
VKSGAYNILNSDDVVMGNAAGGPITQQAPTAVTQLKPIMVFKTDSSVNAVTVSTTSAQTINGAATYVVGGQYAGVLLVPTAGNWIGIAIGTTAPPIATATTLGVVRPDNTTITISGGVLSVPPGGGGGTSVSAPLDPTSRDGQLWGRLYHYTATQVIGCIGDSITKGFVQVGSTPVYNPASPPAPTTMASTLSTSSDTVSASNQGIGGTKASDWQPASANITAAYTAFASAGVRYVQIMLGTNDALASVAAATYGGFLSNIVNDLVAHGYVPVLHYPPATTFTTPNTFLLAYGSYIDTLVNGNSVLAGDKTAYAFYLANPTLLGSDGFHMTQAGYDALGGLWATALTLPVRAAAGPQSTSGVSLGAGLQIVGGQLSITAVGELLVEDGTSAPPVTLTTEAQDDWLAAG